jgi:hypothetical protein
MGTAFDVSFQWKNLTAADVKARGGEGVLVYSGNARPSDDWCKAMRDAGLRLVWIWETDTDAALRGFDYAVEQCRIHESRVPPGELTYVAACDVNDGTLAGRDVTAFLRGWAATTREPVFGQYGSSEAIMQGKTVGGKLQRFWGVAPWLRDGRADNHPENLQRWRDMGVHLIQLVGEDIPGTDTNETVQANWWSITGGDDDVPDEKTFKKWVREVLNEGTGAGQVAWAGTSAETLGAAQSIVNITNGLGTKLDSIAQEVGSGPSPFVLSDDDVQRIAAAIVALQPQPPQG